MREEIIECVFKPLKEDDWYLIKTDKGTYSLRLGGYKREDVPLQIFDYEEISCPYKGIKIKDIYSDDFWVFIILENGGVIASGETDISFSGETTLGVQFENIDDYDKGFFESEKLFYLTTSENGWSKKNKK